MHATLTHTNLEFIRINVFLWIIRQTMIFQTKKTFSTDTNKKTSSQQNRWLKKQSLNTDIQNIQVFIINCFVMHSSESMIRKKNVVQHGYTTPTSSASCFCMKKTSVSVIFKKRIHSTLIPTNIQFNRIIVFINSSEAKHRFCTETKKSIQLIRIIVFRRIIRIIGFKQIHTVKKTKSSE